MITVTVQQHILSSVERGYFPQHGRGFQTVAVSKELVGTRDLHTLERASFYSLSRAHRQQGATPVKDTFFQLPSGRYAVGRCVDFGVDSMGREGNFLAHHLVIESEDLLSLQGNPFALLDAISSPQSLDLTPRDLPAMEIQVASSLLDHSSLEEIPADLRQSLAAAIVDSTERSVLLVVDEARLKSVLRSLFNVLPVEERLHLRFSTHFFESHDLRQLFTLVAVHAREDAPSQSGDYILFDLTSGDFTRFAPVSDYSAWLAESVGSASWNELDTLNRLLDQLRGNIETRERLTPPVNARACAALWERAGTKIARALVGDTELTAKYLKMVPSPRMLADALLELASPGDLCSSEKSADEAAECLALLQASATGRVWREWVQQWRKDAALASIKHDARPWWKLW